MTIYPNVWVSFKRPDQSKTIIQATIKSKLLPSQTKKAEFHHTKAHAPILRNRDIKNVIQPKAE